MLKTPWQRQVCTGWNNEKSKEGENVISMKIIDVHSHIITKEYHAYLEKNNGLLEDSMRLPEWTEQEMIWFMDEAGIDWTLLSLSSPQPYYNSSSEDGIRTCRQVNEYCASLKEKYPDRIKFSAVLPLPDVNAALKEAEYALDHLGASGIKLASNSRGQYLGDAELEPLFSELNARGTVVNIHPHRPEPLNGNLFTAKAIPLFEFFCDTTRAVLNMIANAVIDRYPNLKIVVPHCGAFLPNIADRANGFLPLMNRLGLLEQEVYVKADLQKLYYDTAGNPAPDLLPLLLKIAPEDHIMYGSDYPFTPHEICRHGLEQLTEFLENEPVLKAQKEKIFYQNAEKLYHN